MQAYYIKISKNHIRYYREIAGLSQAELGRAIGVSQQSVNKYEHGRTNPSLATAVGLAELFDVSVRDLFEFDQGYYYC